MFTRSIAVVPHASISSSKRKCSTIDWVAWAQLFVYHGVLVARALEVHRMLGRLMPAESYPRVFVGLCITTALDSASEFIHMWFRHPAAKCLCLLDYLNIFPRYAKGLLILQVACPIIRNMLVFSRAQRVNMQPEDTSFNSLVILDFFLCASGRLLWNVMQFGVLPMMASLSYIFLQGLTSLWAHSDLGIDVRLCALIMVLSTWTQLRDPSELQATRQHLLKTRSQTIMKLQMDILTSSAERIKAIELQVKKISKDLQVLERRRPSLNGAHSPCA